MIVLIATSDSRFNSLKITISGIFREWKVMLCSRPPLVTKNKCGVSSSLTIYFQYFNQLYAKTEATTWLKHQLLKCHIDFSLVKGLSDIFGGITN